MKTTLVVASHNKHKIEEISEIVNHNIELISLSDLKYFEDIPETGNTFVDNAFIKARTIHTLFHKNCLADDSGLEIFSLNNEPGVYSARYAGEPVDHENNIQKVLSNLQGIDNREARFVTVLALILNDKEYIFEGEVRGKISTEKKGNNGFGYDPIFIPDGYEKSFAEMSAEEKNEISHRAAALKKMQSFINSLI